MYPDLKARLAAYTVAFCIFAGVLLIATVVAWGLPAVPNAPIINEGPGFCPDGTLIFLKLYDTEPGGDGYYARWTVGEDQAFLVATKVGATLTFYVQLPGREMATYTEEQIKARYTSPCDIAALVVGAPK